MASQLVSVCIPCHNAAPYVGQAIESILSQTHRNVEVIVVNDGSTDESIDAIKRHLSPKVKVLTVEYKNASKSRNCALEISQGNYVKFFDADDLLNPEALEQQMIRIEHGNNVIASSCWGRFFDDDLRSFKLNPQTVWRDMASLDWLVEAWRDAQPMMQPGLFLVPRELLSVAGSWDVSLSLIDDFEFFARVISSAEQVLFAPKACLYYRSGLSNSLSSRKTLAAAESAFRAVMKGTGHLLSRRSDPGALLSCANVMQNFLYTFYPEYPDLCAAMSARIAELGGSDLPPPGGPWFQGARRLIGWKAARRLQRATGRF